jgi:hypothetical protein
MELSSAALFCIEPAGRIAARRKHSTVELQRGHEPIVADSTEIAVCSGSDDLLSVMRGALREVA